MMHVYLPALALCTTVVLAVTEIEGRANGEKWRKPAPGEVRELYDGVTSVLLDELKNDIETARGYSARTVAWKTLETIVGLGIMIRTVVHFVVYGIGRGGTEWLQTIEPRFELVADPINLPRPAWNDMSARAFCAIIAVTYAQNAPELVWGHGPLVDGLLYAFVVANGAVLLADPLIGIAQLTGKTSMTDNETTHGEQA